MDDDIHKSDDGVMRCDAMVRATTMLKNMIWQLSFEIPLKRLH